MTFYFKPGTTFDRLANFRTGTSTTVTAGAVVFDAGYTFGGENVTFALQTGLDTQQSYTESFEFTSVTGLLSANPTTSSTVLNRDKINYTMPITTIGGTLNAGTANVGSSITVTGTGTLFSSRLPAGNNYRQITGYDTAGNPIYAFYSSTLLISQLPITGTLTIAVQTPAAPDYRLYISGTNTRFLSDLLVTGGNSSTGVLNETISPILQPGQSTPLIYIDNIQLSGTFTWTSNSTSISATNLTGIRAGSTMTFIKPLSGRVYQTSYQPASTLSYTDLSAQVAGNLGPQVSVEIYTPSTSSYSWTCPAGTTSISIVCVGAGGNGVFGGSTKGGGGGGGLATYANYAVTPGSSYTIQIGLPSATDGGDGGDTWFATSTLVRGGGGKGGAGTRAGGTYTGTSGGNGGAGGAAYAGSAGGGGGGGGGGYGYNGGAGGTGYDTLYAAGDPAGQAPTSGASTVYGGAGSGGGAQLPGQSIPLGRGGQASPYYINALVTTAFTGGAAGAPGTGISSSGKPEYGAGGAGGTGASGLPTDSQGGPGVCYIIYDNYRPYDFAGSSLTNLASVPAGTPLNGSTDRRYLRMDFTLPFPVYWGTANNSSNITQVTSYTSLYFYNGYGLTFTSGLGDYYSYGETASNLPRLSVLPVQTVAALSLRNIKYQTEGASPNRQFKLYVNSFQQPASPNLGSFASTSAFYDSSTLGYYRTVYDYSTNLLDFLHCRFSRGYLRLTPQAFSGNSFDGGAANTSVLRQYWSGTVIGAAALTVSSTATSGSATNGYWRLALPWTVYWQGVGYSEIFVSHNSRISFGNWLDYTSSVGITTDRSRQYYNEGAYYTSGGIVGNVNVGQWLGPCINIFTLDGSIDFNRYTDSTYYNSSTGVYDRTYSGNLSPASCQRIYYGVEGTAPYRRYRLRYEGDSSLTQTAGNSRYIWELSFFEHAGAGYNASTNWDTSTVAHRKYTALGFANGTKAELLAVRKYSDPSLAPEGGLAIDHRPGTAVSFNYCIRNEPQAWDPATYPSGYLPVSAWNLTNNSYGIGAYVFDLYNSSVVAVYNSNEYASVFSPLVINETPQLVSSLNLTYEVTFYENSSLGTRITPRDYSYILSPYLATANQVQAVDSLNNIMSQFGSPGGSNSYWIDNYYVLLYGYPVYGVTSFNPSPRYEENTFLPEQTPLITRTLQFQQTTVAQAAKTNAIPSTTSALIRLGIGAAGMLTAFDETSNLPNARQYADWQASQELTSNAIVDVNNLGEYHNSTIARFPRDGYNATTANPNPNPTCTTSNLTSYWYESSYGGGKFKGPTTYTYTLTTGNGVFIFTHGSSATTHSRFLMSKTFYGNYSVQTIDIRVGNWVAASRVIGGTSNSTAGYYGNNMPNPGTGEDLELWYNTSPEPQPPTAGQSPATLGWQKHSTLWAPSGTANENSSTRTVYGSGLGLSEGGYKQISVSVAPGQGYATWLIWQKSFAAQTTGPDQRRSEYAILSWKLQTYTFDTASDKSYSNLIQGDIPKLKYEVTSGTVLRIPSMKSKNSPVWTDYVDYIVAENPNLHTYGQHYTSLIPVTSATTTSTPNRSYINSWYNTTSATTNFGTYFAGLQAAPAFIVETRTIASVNSSNNTFAVTTPMSSTANIYWGGTQAGSTATAAGTRAFAIDRIYSNTSMSVVDNTDPSTIGSFASSGGMTATADRRFTIVSIANETSMTVSGGGIYSVFAGRTSTFPQKETSQFTIDGYHDGSNVTAATIWAQAFPGIGSDGEFYGAEYLPTTRAIIGSTSYAIVSINSDTSLTLLGAPPSRNLYNTGLTLRWNAPSSNIVITGTYSNFLPVTTTADTKIEIQASTTSDARLGKLYIGNQLFNVLSIVNSSSLIASGPAIAAGISEQPGSAFKQTLTYALPRPLVRFDGATWDKTGTSIGVDESLVVQPVAVNFDQYREIFNTTATALSYAANQLIRTTSVTVNSTQSSLVLLITWMKDFSGNATGESSNTLKTTISSAGFTINYDAETQRNYKDVALGRTLMYKDLSYISTSNALTITSTTITGTATGNAVLIWSPSNRLRSGTYGRLVARLTDLSSTAVTITINAGTTGWSSTAEDFLNITVIGAN